MKIPLLWRLERLLSNRKENYDSDHYTTGDGAMVKHKRARGLCSKCGCTKFIVRKNHKKCVKCGEKVQT